MTDPSDPSQPSRRSESTDPHDLGELDPDQFVGEPPAGDATPGEFSSPDQSTGLADRADEAVRTDEADDPEEAVHGSNPSAGGPAGLAGDLGISSERRGPFDGIEATGSDASAQHATDGETSTDPEHHEPDENPPR